MAITNVTRWVVVEREMMSPRYFSLFRSEIGRMFFFLSRLILALPPIATLMLSIVFVGFVLIHLILGVLLSVNILFWNLGDVGAVHYAVAEGHRSLAFLISLSSPIMIALQSPRICFVLTTYTG